MTTIRHATIKGREYRAVTTSYGSGITNTVVQVRVVFADDNGAVWRALPWFAHARTEEVLRLAV